MFLKLMFLSDKKVKGDAVTVAMLKLILSGCFRVAQLILLILAVTLIIWVIVVCLQSRSIELISTTTTAIIWAFIAFMFACLFRLISLEVANSQDRNYLFGLFTSTMAFISVILALIAIMKVGL